ncbi:MAG: right-handed parallel beta-helix repeat-containing protein [Planctomycetes bacterium]|nr:right-handed parallel beta-helix repeat-containing protein [Planctomycetota bacterium]
MSLPSPRGRHRRPRGRAAPALLGAALLILLAVAPARRPATAQDAAEADDATPAPRVLFVSRATTGDAGDGRSWRTAWSTIESALADARDGDEIWVAAGTYTPAATVSGRDATFQLWEGVSLYGGFAGHEANRGARDPEAHPTILSGDIGRAGNAADNCYHVVTGADRALLDGFVIQGGNGRDEPDAAPAPAPNPGVGPPPVAGGPPPGAGLHTSPAAVLAAPPRSAGGGLLCFRTAPVVRNCTFRDNVALKGGAVYAMTARTLPAPGATPPHAPAPRFVDCTFEHNRALLRGGAAAHDLGTSPVYEGCRFLDNACDDKGGGMYNDFGCAPVLVQCLFARNAAWTAAALGNDGGSSPLLVHCTLARNRARDLGGSLYQGTGPANDPVLVGCIVWGNACGVGPAEPAATAGIDNWHDSRPVITGSCVQGGDPGAGNLDADPRFRDAAGGDFRLAPDSPCAGAGYTAAPPRADWERMRARAVARGAPTGGTGDSDEPSAAPGSASDSASRTAAPTAQAVVRVQADSTARAPDGRSWATAYADLQAALDLAWRSDGEVWVAAGSYRPTAGVGRGRAFRLRPGVALYGGFAGDEEKRPQRDPAAHVTVLSGDLGRAGDPSDNAYHVLIGAEYARLDGVTITGGNADGDTYDAKGGALINYRRSPQGSPGDPSRVGGSTTLVNCRLTDNAAREGGALYNYDRGWIDVVDCTFQRNRAENGGAVLDRVGVRSVYTRCFFLDNRATRRGGAFYVDYGSHATLVACRFSGNESAGHGGAVYVLSRASQLGPSTADFSACRFDDNAAAGRGGAIAVTDQAFIWAGRCTFDGNTAHGGAGGGGGGGVAVYFYGHALLQGCLLDRNRADEGADDLDVDPLSAGMEIR